MVFTYHEILPEASAYAYAVSRQAFARHVELFAARRAANLSAAPVITFDDGHLSQYQYGTPLLAENHFRGIFFVTAGWIEKRPAYLTWRELRELIALGHEVQSHSWSHKFLTTCSRDELSFELIHSKETLEQKLGRRVTAISMPGGRWDSRVIEMCGAAGYDRAYTSDAWRKDKQTGPVTAIGRFMVERTTTVHDLERHLQGGPFLALRARHVVKRSIRALVGEGLYLGAWRALRRKRALKEYEAGVIMSTDNGAA